MEVGVVGSEHDRQYTYSLTLRGFRANIVAWISNTYYIFWVRVCNNSYPAWNAQAPYCHYSVHGRTFIK